MKKLCLWLSTVVVLAIASGGGRADYVLSLSTSADASQLHVGDSVTFDVNLAGIDTTNTNTYLSYLAATIGYDNTLLSPNPAVTAGAIIPDSSGFVGTGFSAAADGYYDGVFIASTPISQDGTFFSFQVTALQAGSGTLSFTAAAATLASDPNQTDQFTPQTIDMNFTIEAGSPGIVTPEPSMQVLLISSMLGFSAPVGLRVLASLARRSKQPSTDALAQP
jgi:cohesin domain-containing protein